MSSKLTSLRLLESFIEDLETIIEESEITADPTSSSETPHEVQALSSKIHTHLLKDDDGESYDELITEYNGLISKYPDLKPYQRIERQILAPPRLPDTNGRKSVRFNDTVEVQELNGFKPFSDNPKANHARTTTPLFQDHDHTENQDPDSENENLVSNRDIFITHQQTQLTKQDARLESLSQSVKRSHMLSLDIHGELNEQNIMLNDLEAQLDGTDVKLQRAKRGLDRFTVMMKENKEWFTILVLFIILILLVVIV